MDRLCYDELEILLSFLPLSDVAKFRRLSSHYFDVVHERYEHVAAAVATAGTAVEQRRGGGFPTTAQIEEEWEQLVKRVARRAAERRIHLETREEEIDEELAVLPFNIEKLRDASAIGWESYGGGYSGLDCEYVRIERAPGLQALLDCWEQDASDQARRFGGTPLANRFRQQSIHFMSNFLGCLQFDYFNSDEDNGQETTTPLTSGEGTRNQYNRRFDKFKTMKLFQAVNDLSAEEKAALAEEKEKEKEKNLGDRTTSDEISDKDKEESPQPQQQQQKGFRCLFDTVNHDDLPFQAFAHFVCEDEEFFQLQGNGVDTSVPEAGNAFVGRDEVDWAVSTTFTEFMDRTIGAEEATKEDDNEGKEQEDVHTSTVVLLSEARRFGFCSAGFGHSFFFKRTLAKVSSGDERWTKALGRAVPAELPPENSREEEGPTRRLAGKGGRKLENCTSDWYFVSFCM